jgi:hypothetical protein
MKCALSLFLLLSILLSCRKDEVSSSASPCSYGGNKLTRTSQFAKDIPATIIAIKSPTTTPVISFQIMRGGTAAPLSSCGLPASFAKDSLKVIVSGYLLTFPGIEFVNISPLPFEVTDVKLR